MKKLIVFLLLSFLILLMACTTEKSLPSGFDSLQREDTGAIQILDAPLIEAAQYRAPVSTGVAPSLLFGRHNGVSSRVAIRFTNFSIVDTASVKAAKLTIGQTKKWGEGTAFTGTLHTLNATWDESTAQWTNLKTNYDPANILANFTVEPLDSTSVSIDVPANVVNDWIKGGVNNGLLLDFPQAPFLAQWTSVDVTTGWPILQLIFTTKAGVLDTTTIGPTADISLLEYEQINPEYTLEKGSDRNWLDNITGYRTLLRFDVSSLPQTATIHQALFTLALDQSSTITTSAGTGFQVNNIITDSTWQNLRDMKADTIYIHPGGTISQGLDAVSISTTPEVSYMSAIVQRWVLKTQPNYGLVVESRQYGQDLSRVSLYSELTDAGRKPRLKITYSLPASPRF